MNKKDHLKNNRAFSDSEKELIINKLLFAWKALPNLRLGQLLSNSIDKDLFYIEDFILIEKVENLVKKIKKDL